MAVPNQTQSFELSDKAVTAIKLIRKDAADPVDAESLHRVVSVLADHAYKMGQLDLCFELQSMLLAKPSPNKS